MLSLLLDAEQLKPGRTVRHKRYPLHECGSNWTHVATGRVRTSPILLSLSCVRRRSGAPVDLDAKLLNAKRVPVLRCHATSYPPDSSKIGKQLTRIINAAVFRRSA